MAYGAANRPPPKSKSTKRDNSKRETKRKDTKRIEAREGESLRSFTKSYEKSSFLMNI